MPVDGHTCAKRAAEESQLGVFALLGIPEHELPAFIQHVLKPVTFQLSHPWRARPISGKVVLEGAKVEAQLLANHVGSSLHQLAVCKHWVPLLAWQHRHALLACAPSRVVDMEDHGMSSMMAWRK